LLKAILEALVHPSSFSASLPAPPGFPLVTGLLLATVSSAVTLPSLLGGSSTGGVIIAALSYFVVFSCGTVAAILIFEWAFIRVVGGAAVHAWSVAGATLCPGLVLDPLTQLATHAPALAQFVAHWALLVLGVLWPSLLVYFGVRATVPSRAVLAGSLHVAVAIGLYALVAWRLDAPAA
jgi:hypothetical protein